MSPMDFRSAACSVATRTATRCTELNAVASRPISSVDLIGSPPAASCAIAVSSAPSSARCNRSTTPGSSVAATSRTLRSRSTSGRAIDRPSSSDDPSTSATTSTMAATSVVARRTAADLAAALALATSPATRSSTWWSRSTFAELEEPVLRRDAPGQVPRGQHRLPHAGDPIDVRAGHRLAEEVALRLGGGLAELREVGLLLTGQRGELLILLRPEGAGGQHREQQPLGL